MEIVKDDTTIEMNEEKIKKYMKYQEDRRLWPL